MVGIGGEHLSIQGLGLAELTGLVVRKGRLKSFVRSRHRAARKRSEKG
jgi:hypothetical protein